MPNEPHLSDADLDRFLAGNYEMEDVERLVMELRRLRGIETAVRRFWHTYIEPRDGDLLDDADALDHALNLRNHNAN